jgi:hypothetical protein
MADGEEMDPIEEARGLLEARTTSPRSVEAKEQRATALALLSIADSLRAIQQIERTNSRKRS